MSPASLVLVFMGALVGSLVLSILTARIPRERLLGLPLRCTRCGEPLRWWQVLPVVGWLAQRGHARCGKTIPWVYPFGEALFAAAVTTFAARYGFDISFWYLVGVSAVLIITGAIDWLHRYIYTVVILGPVPIILLLAATWQPGPTLQNAIIGLLFGGGSFLVLFVVARLLFPGNVVPFGLGDVYLALFIGAAMGMTRVLPALFYGVMLAGAYSLVLIILRATGRPNTPNVIAYGAFLCYGMVIYLIQYGLS